MNANILNQYDMPQLQLMIIKKHLHSQFHRYKPGEVYLLNELMSFKFQEKLPGDMKKCIDIVPLDDLIKPLDLRKDDKCKTLVIRSGGIGDLIALSTVCEQMPGKVVFLTQGYYLPVFEWYTNHVTAIDYKNPIFTGFTINGQKRRDIERTMRYAKFDDAIEEGANENWYHIFYKSIGLEIKPELCRPHLVGRGISKNINSDTFSVIISHRASANMRSMALEPIHKAIISIIENFRIAIYVYAETLTEADKNYIESTNDKRIKVIIAQNVGEFLNDLYAADLTISVDSSAIHFREGLKKPAIGIYSSFTSDCRTKYYKYTHSIDIKSNCPLQPCFLHQTKINEVCSEAKEGSLVAPCLNNNTTVEQLTKGFEAAFAKFQLFGFDLI